MNNKEEYFKYVAQKCDMLRKKLVEHPKIGDINKTYELIILTRGLAVNIIEKYIANKSELNRIRRKIKKYGDITKKNEEASIELFKFHASANKGYSELLIQLGGHLETALDLWQIQGGSFEELCNLCNISHKKGCELIQKLKLKGCSFTEYIFITNMDYKNKDGFIEETPDAPLTICIMRYMMNQISNAEDGKKAVREAFSKIFKK